MTAAAGAAVSADGSARFASGDTGAYWDGKYAQGGKLWGDAPSVLAVAAIERLGRLGPGAVQLRLLDIGCGYGRDAVALWHALGLSVDAVDPAARAIEMARAARPPQATIAYRKGGLGDLGDERYDAVFVSNLYQLLDPPARERLRAAVRDRVAPGGLVFVGTLSVSDPQHYGKGEPVPGEPDSFVEGRYLHLCRRDELAADFAFLEIEHLAEVAYEEERPGGPPHAHVSWVLVGCSPGAQDDEGQGTIL